MTYFNKLLNSKIPRPFLQELLGLTDEEYIILRRELLKGCVTLAVSALTYYLYRKIMPSMIADMMRKDKSIVNLTEIRKKIATHRGIKYKNPRELREMRGNRDIPNHWVKNSPS